MRFPPNSISCRHWLAPPVAGPQVVTYRDGRGAIYKFKLGEGMYVNMYHTKAVNARVAVPHAASASVAHGVPRRRLLRRCRSFKPRLGGAPSAHHDTYACCRLPLPCPLPVHSTSYRTRAAAFRVPACVHMPVAHAQSCSLPVAGSSWSCGSVLDGSTAAEPAEQLRYYQKWLGHYMHFHGT